MDRGVFGGLVGLSLATIVVFGLIPALQASRTDVNRTLKDGGAQHRAARHARADRRISDRGTRVGDDPRRSSRGRVVHREPVDPDRRQHQYHGGGDGGDHAAGRVVSDPRTDGRSSSRGSTERWRARAEVVTRLARHAAAWRGRSAAPVADARAGTAQREPAPTVLTIDVAPALLRHAGDRRAAGPRLHRPGRHIRDTTSRSSTNASPRCSSNGGDPIGAQIAVTPANAPANDAASLADDRWRGADDSPAGAWAASDEQSPVVYVPIAAAAPVTSTLMVRHRVDPEAAASLLRAEAQAIDPNVALYRMRTLKQAVREGQWNRHMSAVLADTVTWMSVLLAMVGLYAVTAQRVTLKTREIGLRMALGARSAQIARVILAGLRAPLLLGLLLGDGRRDGVGWCVRRRAWPASTPAHRRRCSRLPASSASWSWCRASSRCAAQRR